MAWARILFLPPWALNSWPRGFAAWSRIIALGARILFSPAPLVKNPIFSEINSFSDFFKKYVDFTKYLAKKYESEFICFPHCGLVTYCWKKPFKVNLNKRKLFIFLSIVSLFYGFVSNLQLFVYNFWSRDKY